eukprot:scaffold2045_cov404-Prasinococcus_capsulatus_cf.AAC.73
MTLYVAGRRLYAPDLPSMSTIPPKKTGRKMKGVHRHWSMKSFVATAPRPSRWSTSATNESFGCRRNIGTQ